MIAPFTKKGFIARTPSKTVSSPNFIGTRCGLPSTGEGDRRANDLVHGFEF
jgi:hypothetical protein